MSVPLHGSTRMVSRALVHDFERIRHENRANLLDEFEYARCHNILEFVLFEMAVGHAYFLPLIDIRRTSQKEHCRGKRHSCLFAFVLVVSHKSRQTPRLIVIFEIYSGLAGLGKSLPSRYHLLVFGKIEFDGQNIHLEINLHMVE